MRYHFLVYIVQGGQVVMDGEVSDELAGKRPFVDELTQACQKFEQLQGSDLADVVAGQRAWQRQEESQVDGYSAYTVTMENDRVLHVLARALPSPQDLA